MLLKGSDLIGLEKSLSFQEENPGMKGFLSAWVP